MNVPTFVQVDLLRERRTLLFQVQHIACLEEIGQDVCVHLSSGKEEK